ncbi:hypothetical protein GGR50DRAFT_577498 [Xylaria sp. CBS 124048]|nr:hypothetical protein GGR50DRAFT_577498 [Xylaria sp. CBS 124048]
MFSIDPALLPSLATRKALIVVDAQNDFLAEDGACPVVAPTDLPQKLGDLASNFRKNGGEVIWVQSQFESPRPVTDEQILIADTPGLPTRPTPRIAPPRSEADLSKEAFLSHDAGKGLACVKPGAPGTEMHPVVKEAVGPKHHVLVKTFYSAFKGDELLRLLRVKFVTELFICGSLTNVGVMATAIDAACYGYTITIVEDCCGFTKMSRHRAAIRQAINTTGCNVLSAAGVLETMTPPPKSKNTSERAERAEQQLRDGRSPTQPPRCQRELERERERQRQRERISSAIQSLAGSDDPQVENKTGRDTVITPTDTSSPAAADVPVSADLSQTALENSNDDARNHEPVISDKTVDRDSPTRNSTSLNPRSSSPPKPLAELRPDAKIHPHVKNGRIKSTSSGSLESPGTTSSANTSSTESFGSTPSTTKRKKGNPMIVSRESDSPESEPLCEGDTKVIYDILPESLAHNIFERIQSEVNWQRMSHQGGEVPRLVAVQGQVDEDGSKPIYRHPADESPPLLPFTPAVDEIRRVVESNLQHPINHVLIQFYRDGNDYISEHSDKTLDIVRDSFIANVSLGAERTMTLRTKRRNRDERESGGTPDGGKREIQRARLPHNSLFQMGLATNMRWMHSIRQDKRLAREKSTEEVAFNGSRISLTFRRIGTFLDGENQRIWGQGATAKTRDEAKEVVNGQTPEAVGMLKAFGRENQESVFQWEEFYGNGFDVLHITPAARLFLSGDKVVNMRVQMMLGELGVGYARGSMADHHRPQSQSTTEKGRAGIKFIDNDEDKTSVEGQREIMLYLQKTYGTIGCPSSVVSGTEIERFEEGIALLDEWREASQDGDGDGDGDGWGLLRKWEGYAGEREFISGPSIGLADFAVWPVLHLVLGEVSLFSSSHHSSNSLKDIASEREDFLFFGIVFFFSVWIVLSLLNLANHRLPWLRVGHNKVARYAYNQYIQYKYNTILQYNITIQ